MNIMNHSVLITGCSSGVGLHTAVLLAKKGYRVFASMRNLEKASELKQRVSEENIELRLLKLDVQDEGSVQAAIEQVIAEAGQMDVLINNAGFGSVLALEQATSQQMNEIMDVNFYGPARCIRAVLPHMRARKSGHIVNITSVGGLVGQPLNEIYCAAKFALEGLVESMAIYLEPYFNVKMTLIEPAGIKTSFVGRVRTDLQRSEAPHNEVYGPILQRYQEAIQKRGSFEGHAQSPEAVAEVVSNCITHPSSALRIQTSQNASVFAAEKLQGDPTGELLQRKIRKLNLGIE